MDNLTHTLLGACLGRAGLDRVSRLAMPTLLISANLPDIDAVAGFWGSLAYLDHHRGVTHSIFGILVEAPLLAATMVAFDRWRRRGESELRPASFGGLLLVALCGLASHLLLDYTNSYGVRPWLPFASGWIYGDLVFIIDPIIWLLLAAGLVLGTRTRPGLLGWSLLGALLTTAVLRVDAVPLAMRWLWCAAVVTMALGRRWGTWSATRTAAAALAALVLYWGGLTVAHDDALRLALHDAPAGQVAALPELADPLRWRAFATTPQTLYVRDVSLLEPPAEQAPWRSMARHLDAPEVLRVKSTYAACVMVGFGRYLVAQVLHQGPVPAVVLSDVRFARPGRPGFAAVRIPVDGTRPVLPAR